MRNAAAVAAAASTNPPSRIQGLIRRFVQLGRREELTAYRVELVPWLWFLSLHRDCRVFQNLTVPQIIELVFLGAHRDSTDFLLDLSADYARREYCVQYRESSLNFVSRLMEEEGIFYYFKHLEDKHILVLAEYDYLQPSLTLRGTCEGQGQGSVYDYRSVSYTTVEQGDRYARIQLEAEEAEHYKVRCTGNCRFVQSGHRLNITNHYRPDINQSYMVLEVRHEGSIPHYRSNGDSAMQYHSEFVANSIAVPYRPPQRAQRPTMHGPQTAVVVGPKGEEIRADQHGRVKASSTGTAGVKTTRRAPAGCAWPVPGQAKAGASSVCRASGRK
jgi:type VI secretion system secreted protein VgrG